MKGKRSLAIALALVFMVAMLAGCADNSGDIIVMVGETPIYRWSFDAYLVRQLSLYEKYSGVDLTKPENASDFANYKNYRIEELIGNAAMLEEARKLGLDQLTAAEEAELDQYYLDYYNQTIAKYQEEYGEDEAGRKKAEKAYQDLLSASSLTPERMRASLRESAIVNKLLEHDMEGYRPSEEELRQNYESTLETYQTEIQTNPLWFGENYTDPMVYAPEGYIDTARITLQFTPKQKAVLSAAANDANEAQNKYTDAVQIYGENSTNAQKLIPMLNRTEEEFRKVLESCYQELTASIEEIRQEVLAGADFIKTMEQKSEDTHLISYFITEGSTHVTADYLAAALKLQNVGDISEVVRIEEGVCFIRLMDFVEPGIRPYEEVKDQLAERMISNARLGVSMNLQTEYAKKAREEGIINVFKNKISWYRDITNEGVTE